MARKRLTAHSFPEERAPLATVQTTDQDGIVIARVAGEIDLADASDVERVLVHACSATTGAVIVDLTDVGYFNSATIKMLFGISERLHAHRRQMRLVIGDGAPMRRMLLLVNFDRLVPFHSTIEEAVAAEHKGGPGAAPGSMSR